MRVYGVNEAVAKFRLVGGFASRRVGYIVYATAQRVRTVGRQLVPKKSRNLEAGIQLVKAGPYNWGVVASSRMGNVSEKNQKEYAGFVEHGTSKMAARPFMRPAATQARVYAASQFQLLAREIERL